VRVLKSIWLNGLASKARLRLYVWLSLVTQILIVVTGGAVRLTGSGLGCPTWPMCTEESLTTTAEMGFHGIIEFGNRLLTFVLLIIAILTFAVAVRIHGNLTRLRLPIIGFFSSAIAMVLFLIVDLIYFGIAISFPAMAIFGILLVLRVRETQKSGIVIPAFGLGLGIIFQAVLGGITVLTGLNSWIVGAHFLVSAFLIAIAAILVFRALPKPQTPVSPISKALAWPTAVVSLISIIAGIIVTGAGPHAGDIDTPRNGFNLEIWQHFHSYPGYLMLALILIQLFFQFRVSKRLFGDLPTRALFILLLVTIGQAVVGVVQARLGVPALLVGIHMLGAATLAALVAFQLLLLRQKTNV
jgi:cytochrome c oxidase assembly protein subunit 15